MTDAPAVKGLEALTSLSSPSLVINPYTAARLLMQHTVEAKLAMAGLVVDEKTLRDSLARLEALVGSLYDALGRDRERFRMVVGMIATAPGEDIENTIVQAAVAAENGSLERRTRKERRAWERQRMKRR